MKFSYCMTGALCFLFSTAHAKDVPVLPAEYRMFNVYADRGHPKQCAVFTEAKGLLEQFTALGVGKPEAVLGLIKPPIDWTQSAVLLMYQPDPPPDAVPKVRSLLKDVNREKLTLLFRYVDPNAPEPAPPPPDPVAARPSSPPLATTFTLKAYTLGTDDKRDRAGYRSPLLLLVVPTFGFLSGKTLVECTQKL